MQRRGAHGRENFLFSVLSLSACRKKYNLLWALTNSTWRKKEESCCFSDDEAADASWLLLFVACGGNSGAVEPVGSAAMEAVERSSFVRCKELS